MVAFSNLIQGDIFNNLKNSKYNIFNNIEGMDTITESNIEKSQSQLNQLLLEYSKSYQLLINEMLKNQTNPLLQKYVGKIVTISEGNDDKYYYINNFGFSQVFSPQAWAARPRSCQLDIVPISAAEFIQFPVGPALGVGVDCGLEGNNIADAKTGKPTAWINIRGERYDWSSDNNFETWNTRSQSCKDANLKYIDEANFKGLQSSGSNPTICNNLNVDPQLLTTIANLKKQIVELGKDMIVDIQKLRVNDAVTQLKINQTREIIKKKIEELEKDENDIATGNLDVNDMLNPNLKSLKNDTHLRVVSNYSIYLVWIIIIIILLYLVYGTITGEENSKFVMILIYLIVIYGVYLIVKAIFGIQLDFNKTNNLFSVLVVGIIYIFIIYAIYLVLQNVM